LSIAKIHYWTILSLGKCEGKVAKEFGKKISTKQFNFGRAESYLAGFRQAGFWSARDFTNII